jgi:hypothetical protein
MRLALIASLAAALPAAAHAGAARTTHSCGGLTVSAAGPVTTSNGGGPACFLKAFTTCTPASFELSRFGVDTVARTSFGILRNGKTCEVTVKLSFQVVPQKARASGGGTCGGLVRRGTDVVATGCHGTGLTRTISLTGRR